ncbi:unnamed protein product [Cyclocybe aegerita]|uniref:Nephrocystin 3-like N-terminal domain-containing protein n=1 Tax=Cyclocybe aegerita TaxID=1973307 RepID=A0A8S0WAZ5_CYCAE|nr:unnamed protein product [Cyclocybe aegerita]
MQFRTDFGSQIQHRVKVWTKFKLRIRMGQTKAVSGASVHRPSGFTWVSWRRAWSALRSQRPAPITEAAEVAEPIAVFGLVHNDQVPSLFLDGHQVPLLQARSACDTGSPEARMATGGGIHQFSNAKNVHIENSTFLNNSYHNYVNHINVFARSDEIMRRLRPPHYIKDPFVEHQQARLESTCHWAIEHPVISHWLEAQGPLCNHLWLYGGPGTGKSILASFLVEHIRKSHHVGSEITLYHFSKENEDKPVHVLMDFIRQILLREDRPFHPKMDFFVKWVTDERQDYQFSLEQMAPFFCDFIDMFQGKWLVMDGLDECQDVIALLKVFSKVTNAKILVLSRKERYIEAELQDWPKLEIGGTSEATTEGDLESFVREQVDGLVDDYGILESESERLKNSLLLTSGHMFLYARFKCEMIRNSRPSTQDHVEKIITSLETSPASLAVVYNKYLTQHLSDNLPYENEIALRTLQWIIYSPQPVTLNLLRQVLAIDISQDEGISPNNVPHDVKSVISNAVGILVDWRLGDLEYYRADHQHPGQTYFASLAHHSIREFLVGLTPDAIPEQWRSLDIPYGSLLPSAANSSILLSCIYVTRGAKVWDTLQAYHDSADQRRRVCPSDRKRLGRQLCLNKSWDLWEEKQRHRLVKDRNWRKTEKARLVAEVQDIGEDWGMLKLEWVQHSVERLRLIQEAEEPYARDWEHKTLTSLMAMRERDPMLYAFAHVGHHLSEAKPFRDAFLTTNFLQLTRRWKRYAYTVLKKISRSTRKHRNMIYTRDTILALESFLDILESIEQLSRSLPFDRPPPWTHTLRSTLRSYFTLYAPPSSPCPRFSDIWTPSLASSLSHTRRSHLHRLFTHTTHLIASLSFIEASVFTYDAEIEPLIGSGILLHAIRFCRHTLAQWAVVQALNPQSDPSGLKIEIDGQVMKNDHYLFPKLLRTEVIPGVEAKPPVNKDTPLSERPERFGLTLLVCGVLGYCNARLLQLAVIFAHLSKTRMRRYSFHPPSESSFYLRVVERCSPIPVLAQIFGFSFSASLVVVLPILALNWVCRDALEAEILLATGPQIGLAIQWLHANPDLVLSLYNSCGPFGLATQLNICIVYLIFRQIMCAMIDPVEIHRVLALYQAQVSIEDSVVVLAKKSATSASKNLPSP